MMSLTATRSLPMILAAACLAFGGAGCAGSDEADDDANVEGDPTAEGDVVDEGDSVADSAAITVGGANCYYVHYRNPNSPVPVYRRSTRGSRYDSVPARSRAYLVNPDGSQSSNGYVRSKNGSLRIQWTMGMAAWVYYKNVSCGG